MTRLGWDVKFMIYLACAFLAQSDEPNTRFQELDVRESRCRGIACACVSELKKMRTSRPPGPSEGPFKRM